MAFSFEQTVRRECEAEAQRDRQKQKILYAFSIIFAVAALFGLVVAAGGNTLLGVVQMVLCAVAAAFCWFKKDKMIVEYDYTLNENNIMFAQILNLEKRRELVALPYGSIKHICRADNNLLVGLKAQGCSEINCCLNSIDDRYAVYAENKGVKYIVYFEPADDFLTKLKQAAKINDLS